ncbi:hypothetical protein BS17DRAFT_303322 [Gyrodon lividus]|nr:hypothetical protein BS17DRAFT_303322 [Gyrodon lividus]
MPSGHLSTDTPILLQLNINAVAAIVSLAILLYDYVLTLEREVCLFWGRPRLSWAFGLFIVNRYITLLVHVPHVVETFWTAKPDSHSAVPATDCSSSVSSESFLCS